ncbi:MAG: hypothetical protein IJK66_00300, partial [Bacilli bacterium]|nr:hypothetical protein [Bacilli bacterium]
TSIPCSDVAKLSDDYSSCSITYDSNGIATVKLKGTSGGKFDKMKCIGTKDTMNCTEITPLPGYTDAAEYLASLCTGTCPKSEDSDGIVNENGMIQDKYGNYRYQGSNPNNYVYFNCTDNSNPTSSTCEIWRIIGLFDERIKLVRKDAIGSFSWDTTDSSINNGWGINQWGPSGTYEGADLMRELNGDYLNSSLSANTLWYNGASNKKEGTFNKDYVLKSDAQELIGEAIWFLGGVPYVDGEPLQGKITLEEAYAYERGTLGKICTSGTHCTDEVVRTYTWTGKVGLIYPSDFGYASGNTTGEKPCSSNISHGARLCDNNWLSSYGWTISPAPRTSTAVNVWAAYDMYSSSAYATSAFHRIKPSVYLIPGVQMKGSGTTADPYIFAE